MHARIWTILLFCLAASLGVLAQGEVVRLKIGVRKFVTTVGTLTANGTRDNYFARLFSGQLPPSHLPIGEKETQWVFIDRNGRYFEPLLDFLRTGEWLLPQGMDERLVLREAEFYSIEVPRLRDLAVSNVALRNQALAHDLVLKPHQRLVRFLEQLMLSALMQEKPSLDVPATPWISVWPRKAFISAFTSAPPPGSRGMPQVKLTFNDIAYYDPHEDENIKDISSCIRSEDLPAFTKAVVWHMHQQHGLTVSADRSFLCSSGDGRHGPVVMGVTPGDDVQSRATMPPLLQFRWCPFRTGHSASGSMRE